MKPLTEHLKRSISALEALPLKAPFKQNHAFQHARLIGEILALGGSVGVAEDNTVFQHAKHLLKSHESWFLNPIYLEALAEDIKQMTDAHSRELKDISYFLEAEAFYELNQLLVGRDGLAFVSEAVRYFGDNRYLKEAIDRYQTNDEIVRKHIKDLRRIYADDFLGSSTNKWYPSWFWWRYV